MREKVIQEYQQRKETYQASFEQSEKQSRAFSFGRLATFIGGAIISYLVLEADFRIGIGVSGLAVAAFFYIVKRHSILEARKVRLGHLLQVNDQEIKAQSGNFSHFASGKEFIDPKHSYSFDLDIFGNRSIFQFVNRTASVMGFQKLAAWFSGGWKEKAEILRRQEAIRDLAGRLEFRQNFLALGQENLENEEGTSSLSEWLEEPFYYLSHKWYKLIIWGLPILLMLVFGASFVVEAVTWHYPVLLILLNFWIIRQNLKRVMPTHSKLSRKSRILEKYGDLVQLIENESFEAPYLNEIQTRLSRKGLPASESIKRLAAISKAFDNRLNIAAAILLNGTILWDIQIMFRLEKWKQDARTEMMEWFEVLSEIDGLVSLGGLSYNHPEYIFPTVEEEEHIFKGIGMGHVLLDPQTRVDNDLSLKGDGQYIIITGANMAGKSTFLRTVGVNLVLAMMGAPVCAKTFEFTPIQIATSVRATDSLQDNESYFYAELLRLKSIVDQLRDGSRLFVIIDEMLRGTNSRDKQIGSRGFIEQLIQLQGMGLIATHDLSLGTLMEEYPGKVRNMRFEIEITEDQLHFDYTLRDGISQNLNATFLMRKMGIME